MKFHLPAVSRVARVLTLSVAVSNRECEVREIRSEIHSEIHSRTLTHQTISHNSTSLGTGPSRTPILSRQWQWQQQQMLMASKERSISCCRGCRRHMDAIALLHYEKISFQFFVVMGVVRWNVYGSKGRSDINRESDVMPRVQCSQDL